MFTLSDLLQIVSFPGNADDIFQSLAYMYVRW